LTELPHWARVAFAARCARQALPLFLEHWPDAKPERIKAIENAIALAERSAAEAAPAPGLQEAVMQATMVAGTALSVVYGFPFEEPEPLPPDGNAGAAASYVAKIAEKAAQAAASSSAESTRPATESFTFAEEVLRPSGEMRERLVQDFIRLRETARQQQWNDQRNVPQGFWQTS
jgi:hypothetical protein